MASSNTPFPLGVFVGGPNGSDPSRNAAVDSQFSSFTQVMGTTPQFMDAYIDQSQPIDAWASNASWTAWSWAQDSNAHNLTPVIAMPMTSSAMGLSPDQLYQNFASGQYDGAIRGMVQSWASQGFTTQYWRPGWEMNVASMPNYIGDDSHTQSDWISAFQHISNVLHSAGSQDGVNVQVGWNPNVHNWNTTNPLTLYPGNQYVDVIVGDMYDNAYPYSLANLGKGDGSTASSFADWASNPANLKSYYSNPAATPWSTDGSGGHSLSLQNLLDFARAQGKPVAIAETGAGGSGEPNLGDNAAFPQWLASTLAASGDQVKFVNVWNTNDNGNWDFSSAGAGKPNEAAAWAQAFGGNSPTAPSSPPAPAPASASAPTLTPSTTPDPSNQILLGDDPAHTRTLDASAATTVGSGPDSLTLYVSEDAWNGDAQFTVSVNGQQVGGTLTATANHGAGETQAVTINGNFGNDAAWVSTSFVNDAYGGSPSTDRNLHIDGLGRDNASVNLDQTQWGNGTSWFVAPSILPAPSGDATLAPTWAPSVFDFSAGNFGHDTISGFDPSRDILKFSQSQVANYAAAQNDLAPAGNDTLMQIDPNHSVLLQGVSSANLNPSNFAFA